VSASCAPLDDAVAARGYSATALFCELDGQSFSHYENLVDRVLELMNAHLREFPVGYGHREALALARERGWLSVSPDGRSVTVLCGTPAETSVAALA
jgi:hypothetical protein